MRDTPASIFRKIVTEKGLLDEEALDRAEAAAEDGRAAGKGASYTVERACLDLGLLTEAQVRGIEAGRHYYIVRKADKTYAKIAVRDGLVASATVEKCLAAQKREYLEKRRLVRLSRLLLDKKAISAEDDAAVREQVVRMLSPEESAAEAEAIPTAEIIEIDGEPGAASAPPASTDEIVLLPEDDDSPIEVAELVELVEDEVQEATAEPPARRGAAAKPKAKSAPPPAPAKAAPVKAPVKAAGKASATPAKEKAAPGKKPHPRS